MELISLAPAALSPSWGWSFVGRGTLPSARAAPRTPRWRVGCIASARDIFRLANSNGPIQLRDTAPK